MRALLFALALFAGGAHAVEPGERLADPALEARARAISAELRCLVCQNQSIDDSNAELAHDLRVLVRERLAAGDSDPQVLQFVTARYGDYVLLQPPVNARTLILWAAPALILLGGLVLVVVQLRRRRAAPPPAALSADEERRLSELTWRAEADAAAAARPDHPAKAAG